MWLPVPNNPKLDVYTQKYRIPFVREVLRRVRALPGVSIAAMGTAVPLSQGNPPAPITVEGLAGPAGDSTLADIIGVSPDYFTVLRTPLVSGRFFTESDQSGSQFVALVDRATAARYWPGQSPLGKRVKIRSTQFTADWATVIGVVGNIRQDAIDAEGTPHVYYSIYQLGGRTLNLMVRSAADPVRLGESLRRQVQAVDPNLPVFSISTLSGVVESSLTPHRFSAQLMGAFAVLALLLAAIGIYGVLAYFVGQRVREIGVRMALGASRAEVVRLVLSQGMAPILAGTAVGLVGSFACSRLLGQLLYGVSTSDPLVFLAVPAFLLMTAFAASYIPARRATRVDPLTALRCD